MQIVQPILASHEDSIHDVAYDYYGRRMASCSSDHKIKVWDKDPGSGEWKCSAEWKAHLVTAAPGTLDTHIGEL